jgi:RecB family exonuclease
MAEMMVEVEDVGSALPAHLSPSQISTFEKCQLSYWFSSVNGWREPPQLAQIAGSLVHDVLENLLKLPQVDRSRDTAWDLLREVGATTISVNQSWLNDRSISELKIKSADSLKNYFKLEDPTQIEIAHEDLERPVTAIVKDVKLYGRLDRITRKPVVRISDYKTSKKPDPKYLPETLRQVMLYAAGLQIQGQAVDEVELIYLGSADRVVRPTYPSALDRALFDLVNTRGQMQTALENKKWTAKTGPLCRYCAFSSVCPAKNTEAAKPGTEESEAALLELNLEKRTRVNAQPEAGLPFE